MQRIGLLVCERRGCSARLPAAPGDSFRGNLALFVSCRFDKELPAELAAQLVPPLPGPAPSRRTTHGAPLAAALLAARKH